MTDPRMNVYLVPLGTRRYELYCEVGDGADAPALDGETGWVARFEDKFRAMMQAIDRRSRESSGSFWARARNRGLAWLAERVAEQRLLWQLRLHREATLHFPTDMPETEAHAFMRQSFRADLRRHWWWLGINGVLLALAGLLTVIPGPNVVAFYFAFRVVGHYMSIRGARHALADVQWATAPSEPLTDLRRALTLEPATRARRLSQLAEQLSLEKLAPFVERMLLRGA